MMYAKASTELPMPATATLGTSMASEYEKLSPAGARLVRLGGLAQLSAVFRALLCGESSLSRSLSEVLWCLRRGV